MITLIHNKVLYSNGEFIELNPLDGQSATVARLQERMSIDDAGFERAKSGSIACKILSSHNHTGDSKALKLDFDALASHDITYVGVVQTARASGLTKFPIPYVLTNCHNSLCAVGGTINEDDHVFGLSAAQKYGGIYVPPHIAVIHQYMREMMAGCGKMILGSDSHTRYGALGAMGIGEGGPEIVKQLLGKTYDISAPQVVCVQLNGKVRRGVGPQDVALAIIASVFQNGFAKNKVLEFVGEGISGLSVDYRCGIDVMTTETTCLTSIWATDDKVKQYYHTFGREDGFKVLNPEPLTIYDSAVVVNLDKIEPMIAMPFHPSNVYKLADVIQNPADILNIVEKEAVCSLDNKNIKLNLKDRIIKNQIHVSQGVIAGCAGGTYENIIEAASILKGANCGNTDFSLSVYPASQPIYLDLIKKGALSELVGAGAIVKTAFCGPCFGAGDVPSNHAFSIRHTTRNFPNREGSKPGNGQIASVALMDARSIAATAAQGGILTSAMDLDYDASIPAYNFDKTIYDKRIYNGFKKPVQTPLIFGPNIADWPTMIPLTDHLMIKIASAIFDPVTTTDELIPSGETSSYRSNPLKLAEYTLSRKDPTYVKRAKAAHNDEIARREQRNISQDCIRAFDCVGGYDNLKANTAIGSAVFALKPGDGSAREQAASCQRVLGGCANIAGEYATKRYRSNLINWGIIPFITEFGDFQKNDYVFVENVKDFVKVGGSIKGKLIRDGKVVEIVLKLDALTDDEREIILSGCLINFYKNTLYL